MVSVAESRTRRYAQEQFRHAETVESIGRFPIVLVSDRCAFIGHNINIGVAVAIDRSGSLMVIVKKWLDFWRETFSTELYVGIELLEIVRQRQN